MGEWESLCEVTGWNGMPGLKIRPKALSRHGRQYVYKGWERQSPVFNIGKVRGAGRLRDGGGKER